jgi:two-component system chemotaxis response regulator CheY
MNLNKKRVLVVDDAMFMRILLKDILTKLDFEIVGEASDGEEAILKFQNLKPDLTTLDLTMPKMDGLETLKAILALDPNANVIICSATGESDKVQKALELGAKNFITKPFNPNKVSEILKRYA